MWEYGAPADFSEISTEEYLYKVQADSDIALKCTQEWLPNKFNLDKCLIMY